MALSDFVTDGQIPAGSAAESVTKQTVLPDWYTNYATNLLAGQQALSAQPLATYQAPRVAGFTPGQQQGFDMTKAASTAYQPVLSSAIGTATGVANGPRALPTAQGYFGQATSLNPVAASGGDFDAARALAGQSGATNTSAVAQPYWSQALAINPSMTAAGDFSTARSLNTAAANASGAATASPYLTGAVTNANTAAQTGGLAAASPYLTKAGGNATDVSAYLNPYTDTVVNRVGELAGRNLSDNIMPAIEGRYIGAGQLGYNPATGFATPSGMMTDTARAIRDTQEAALNEQGQLLNQGYTQAQGAMQTDLGRQAQLASTAGGLGTADQAAKLNAAGLESTVGQAMGGLTNTDASRALTAAGQSANIGATAAGIDQAEQGALTTLGNSAAGVAGSDASRALSAGNTMASIGSTVGGLTQAQQALLAQMGTSAGSMATSDANTGLASANQMGGLASLSQNLGLTGANAVTAVGTDQQKLNQQNLDVAYQDFLKQQGYPQSQIDAMLKTFQGVSAGVPSATQEDGIVPSGVQAQYQPSTASQIASGLTGVAGILSAIGKL